MRFRHPFFNLPRDSCWHNVSAFWQALLNGSAAIRGQAKLVSSACEAMTRGAMCSHAETVRFRSASCSLKSLSVVHLQILALLQLRAPGCCLASPPSPPPLNPYPRVHGGERVGQIVSGSPDPFQNYKWDLDKLQDRCVSRGSMCCTRACGN